MIIRYFSDLHLEFIEPKNIYNFISQINPGLNEVCVLAGDIGNPYESNYDIFMNFINDNFQKTFIIAGNHEYYNKTKTIEETNDYLKNYFFKFNNVKFLNNDLEYYNGYTFIGTTLWSNIEKPRYKINDVHCIPNFDYLKYNLLNQECVSFLENALNNNDNCIVITHHMPSEKLIHQKYKTWSMIKYNQWFYCNMEHLITPKIKGWFYGHTHMPSEIIMNDVPLLCNPIGYPDENINLNFNKKIVIE